MTSLYRANAESLGRVFADLGGAAGRVSGSTDMANISLAIPTIHPMLGLGCFPISNHQPEFAAFCITETADRAAPRRRQGHGHDRGRPRGALTHVEEPVVRLDIEYSCAAAPMQLARVAPASRGPSRRRAGGLA